MVGVIWYRFVRCGGTDWSDTLVPTRPLQWYRLKRYVGTDSSATVVPIRRYYQEKCVFRSISVHLCRYFRYICAANESINSAEMAGTVKDMSLIKQVLQLK